jgi:hypothetical protein
MVVGRKRADEPKTGAIEMTTATISTTALDTIRTLLAGRASALADLAPASAAGMDRDWTLDRIADIEHANQTIERMAGRFGIDPADLIALAVA